MFQTSIDTPIGRPAILADDATLTATRVGAPASAADDPADSAASRAAAQPLCACFLNDLNQSVASTPVRAAADAIGHSAAKASRPRGGCRATTIRETTDG